MLVPKGVRFREVPLYSEGLGFESQLDLTYFPCEIRKVTSIVMLHDCSIMHSLTLIQVLLHLAPRFVPEEMCGVEVTETLVLLSLHCTDRSCSAHVKQLFRL